MTLRQCALSVRAVCALRAALTILADGGVGSRTVGEERNAGRVEGESLSEESNGTLVVVLGERRVTC